jgi:type I restriction enzyme S subunit
MRANAESAGQVMSEIDELPRGWRQTTVNESIRIIDYRGRTPPFDGTVIPHLRSQNVKSGRIVWEDLAYVSEETYDAFMTRGIPKTGDILFTTEAPLGEVAPVPDQKFSVAQRIMVLRPSPEEWSPLFLMYQLMSPEVQARIRRKGTGSTVTGVASRNFKPLALRVAPLPQQRRIVAEIEKQFTRLEAGVEALRRVQANLKRYRAAVLKAACEGSLTPTEAEWPQKQIATAIQTMDQGWSPKCESEPSVSNTTWAVIKTTAIQHLRFLEVENKTLPTALKPRAHLELVPGDLLVTRAGPRSRVGVACLVKSTRPRLMLCDKAYRLRCKPDVAHPAFLELVLNAPHIQDELNKLKTGISDSGVNLTQKRFGELLVPFPPLDEQTRIVAEVERRLSVVEELESVVSANLQRATRLRQSILQKAFTGGL